MRLKAFSNIFIYSFLLYFESVFSRRDDSVIVILCRNEELNDILNSLKSFEETFNSRYHYPYVFLNDKPWDQNFIEQVSLVVSSDASFDQVKPEDWQMPNSIDRNIAIANWNEMLKKKVPYANLESYHNMCRFFSRSFYNQPLVKNYKYYWRIEPGVTFHCNIGFDPFERMEENGWKYGFTISIGEFMHSIATLGEATKEFERTHSHLIPKNIDRLNFIFDNKGNYNGCHFWSNFEIGSFELFRSPGYQAYVDFLERKGGFYYERWGDAPVHTLAAQMFLDKKEVHFFEEIGYTHPPFTHCPQNAIGCSCLPSKSIDFTKQSCLPHYLSEINAFKDN